MRSPRLLSLEELADAAAGRAVSWVLPRFAERASARFGLAAVERLDQVPPGAEQLVVLGGGTRIDQAKLWRRDHRPDLFLVAIPSVWGSGAEVSPIVALTRAGRKHVELDEALVPDARSVWPELAEQLPLWRARAACGDAWSHALEGFLSPLASDGARRQAADVVGELLALPLARDPRWFEASARACLAQAQSGVGLVHGIAHVLEPALAGGSDGREVGHAALCATFLWPVLVFDRRSSRRPDELAGAHGVDLDRVEQVARELFDAELWRRARPVLEERWQDVLRDPCTRTNSVLVRPDALEHFREERFR